MRIDPLVMALGLLEGLAAASPSQPLSARALTPVLNRNFPDPSMFQDSESQWFAYATNGNGKQVQMAQASNVAGPWTYLQQDAMPQVGKWCSGKDTWAPDVRKLTANKYVLFYSGRLANSTSRHCVGTATATSPTGPFQGADEPLYCHIEQGGSIDPSGFYDVKSNTRWVVYKIDGNAVGHGGECGNTVAPIVATPIMLQQLSTSDWTTPVGKPIQIFDRIAEDGPYVEAPNLIRTFDGTYILFYSGNCYQSPKYNVRCATSKSLMGPYTRCPKPLIVTGDRLNLTTPGGATSVEGGGRLLFHAKCPSGSGRCMNSVAYTVKGTNVTIDA